MSARCALRARFLSYAGKAGKAPKAPIKKMPRSAPIKSLTSYSLTVFQSRAQMSHFPFSVIPGLARNLCCLIARYRAYIVDKPAGV